jgi:hypothetical protein
MLEIDRKKIKKSFLKSSPTQGPITVIQAEVNFEYKKTGRNFLVYAYYFKDGLQEGEQLYFKTPVEIKLV